MHRVFGSHRRSGGAHSGGAPPTAAQSDRSTVASPMEATSDDSAAAGVAAENGCDCVLALRNTQDPAETRARVKVNGLVAGASSRISWANRFHMGLNPNVLSGR